MVSPLLLASGSEIRSRLLRDAGVPVEAQPAKVDEAALRAAMTLEGVPPRDQADMLAEAKARKMSGKHPQRLVLGCDQILDLGGTILSKPETEADLRKQLQALSGQRHTLWSAAVLCESGRPVWRHVGELRLTMRVLSESFLDGYITRNGASLLTSLGGYKLEEEGIRLFTALSGDYHSGLGLPLLPLLSNLVERGFIET